MDQPITEFKRYGRWRIEKVEAAQTLVDMEVQTHPEFSGTTIFPPGSYIVKHSNGQQQIIEEAEFLRYYQEIKEAEIAE